jgi:hypothetical protein
MMSLVLFEIHLLQNIVQIHQLLNEYLIFLIIDKLHVYIKDHFDHDLLH